MEKWFELSEEDRKNIFIQTSNQTGLSPTAVEKDWWVMIALRGIFRTNVAEHLVFKGGTSLSKGWGLIERFSEDIDLAIDRGFFKFKGNLTRKEVTKLRKTACEFVTNEFIGMLNKTLDAQGVKEYELSFLAFERSDTDPVAIELKYKSLTENVEYLQPRILIEISSRSLKDPFQNIPIVSLIGEIYKGAEFSDLSVDIPTVNPERTLIEKMFLLHEEFQKMNHAEIKSSRMTRHLYDISKLIDNGYADIALVNMELYQTVINQRESLTNLTWVDYSKHQPKTLNFIPHEDILKEWERDYLEMQESMFYGQTDSFENLIIKLKKLNDRINRLE